MSVYIGPWVEKISGEWRRYWCSPNELNPDSDLAAIVGVGALGPGWRTFSPEGERKWLREGGAATLDEAKQRADEALRAKYGV